MLTPLLFLAILPADSTLDKTRQMEEVVVVSEEATGRRRSMKGQTASIDEHLSAFSQVNLIRRGSYAWEPVVNNMQMERLSTTIDGMKIFYACTDKMDPVTSYVESGNLQSISLNSGLEGNPQATGNIGGSLDLRLRKVGFDNDPFSLTVSAGHELNGHLQVYGADAAVSSHRFYTNLGSFYRHAGNYKVGGGDVLPFSQFRKVNVFANGGVRITDRDVIEGTFIFDKAANVGYPALNMDVAKAQGVITSLSYKHLFKDRLWNAWETKVYYNHIIHEMDDTHRPDVIIHMDMPGDSRTAGFYSMLTGHHGLHDLQVNYDLYYNRLFADMTMYLGGASPMYMVTWPDVGTFNTGLSLADCLSLSERQSLRLSAKVAWQQQRLNNDEGWQALKVFFPHMHNRYQQTTARLAARYQYQLSHYTFSVGAGWGSRAPTPTEAYGYYLNNTFDLYDYIGNPALNNESAFELNASVHAAWSDWDVKVEGNAFFFSNYIIGQFEPQLSAMTVGAKGVKVYTNQPHSSIVNLSVASEWTIADWLQWNGKASFSYGCDKDGKGLPLISPLAYSSGLRFVYRQLEAQLGFHGNLRQHHVGTKYGETPTAAWTIWNLSAVVRHHVGDTRFSLRMGVENLFDKRYSAYSDWNGIPQKGLNIYTNLTVQY